MARTRTVPRRKAPACTHVSMERIPLNSFDLNSCPSCGEYRTLGFVYICRQERDISYLESISSGKAHADGDPATSTLRRELKRIGLSESVISTAEQGLYTQQQLGKLVAQKTELNRVIANALQHVQGNESLTGMALGGNPPPNTDGTSNSTPVAPEPITACNLIACHACRPYFKDRISMSFDAVFNDEILPIQPSEAHFLPVKSAHVMRTIGAHPIPFPPSAYLDVTPTTLLSASGFSESDGSPSTPSQSSMFTYKTTQSEIDTLNTTRRHRRLFYKMGHRSSGEIGRKISRDLSHLPLFARNGLRAAFKGVFRASRESSSSGSNITLPMPRTATARDSGDLSSIGEFDMGALRRVRRQKERFDLRDGRRQGIYVPRHSYEDGLRRQTSASHANGDSDSSGVSVYSCASEGSEVEVEGGVALTEEAVETHRPDIISDPLALESIMTQM